MHQCIFQFIIIRSELMIWIPVGLGYVILALKQG